VEIAWTSVTSEDGGLCAFLTSRIVGQETLQDGSLLSSQHGTPLPLKRATSPSSEQQATYIYFFGYKGLNPEVCFQQWFPSPSTDDSLDRSPSFPTSEHYMMYRKALLFGDEVVAKKILAAEAPGEAKILGRQAGDDRSCDEMVDWGNYLKFSQNPKLKKVLWSTGSKVIVEASSSDRIWETGFDTDHVRREKHRVANQLGEASMRVRQRLR
ncbi:hypothetical protein BGZ57DRAFT_981004, partial [Hyaloscypha finlandica]